jgi:hypothetical protein
MKKNKYELLSFIIPLMALFSVYFYFKIILDLNLNGFGSDFTEQHLPLYDYIRQSFYMTHDLFPQMNMRHGGISSFANLVYYGSMNPFIWFSFLFPFISMQTYLELIMIPFIAFISYMNFNILKFHFKDEKINLITAIAFSVVPVILTHLQFQYAFIWFYPFFLISMWAIQKFESRYIYFMLSFSMVFYFNLQFAFATCFFLFLYMNYLYFEKQLTKQSYFKYFMLFVYANIVALMIGFLPFIVQGLASNARSIGNGVSGFNIHLLKYMFITDTPNGIGYQWGLYLYALVAFLSILYMKRNKMYLFIVFLVLSFLLGPIMYFLNMFVYEDIKVFMYYIPIMMILFTFVMIEIKKYKYYFKVVILIILNVIILTMIEKNFGLSNIYFNVLFIQNIVLITILFTNKNFYYYTLSFLVVTLSFLTINSFDEDVYVSQQICEPATSLNRVESDSNMNSSTCQQDFMMTEYTSIFNEYLSSYKTEIVARDNIYIFSLKNEQLSDPLTKEVLSIGENTPPFITGVEDEYIYKNNSEEFSNVDMMTHVESENSIKEYNQTYDDYTINEPILLQPNIEYNLDISNYCSEYYDLQIENFDSTTIRVNGIALNQSGSDSYYSGNCNQPIILTATETVTIEEMNFEFYTLEELKTTKYPIYEPYNVDIKFNESIEFDIDMPNGGKIITTIPYDDGYMIEIDGESVSTELVNNYFLGFPIEEGTHHVKIEFRIKGFYIGMFVSLFGLAIVLILIYKKIGV